MMDQNAIQQIITLTAKGKTQKEIAKVLNIERSTVSRCINKPENKSTSEKLKETLQNKHTTRFAVRKIREERSADLLSRIALGEEVKNDTMYQDIDDIEKYLARQDKSGLKIAQGTGVLKSPLINFNSQTNIQNNSITNGPGWAAFQEYMDMKSKERQIIDVNEDGESDDS